MSEVRRAQLARRASSWSARTLKPPGHAKKAGLPANKVLDNRSRTMRRLLSRSDMRVSTFKPVILIGGTAGTGKTTLASELTWRLGLDHRIGTGFIREIIKSQHRREDCPELHGFTFRAAQPIANIVAQAERLRPAIMACIERARREGTSLLIEGTHLLPSLYHDAPVDLFAVLAAPEFEEHRRRLNGPSHLHRRTTDGDFTNVRLIDHYLGREAARWGIRYESYGSDVERFMRVLQNSAVA